MDIINYPQYLIYRDGKVWSKRKKKYMKTNKTKKGYYYLTLCNDDGRKKKYIHRLIAIHYIANPNSYSQVDHKNRIRTDNRIENLRWVTHSSNSRNTGMRSDNTSGHKYIYYNITKHKWRFYISNDILNKSKTCESKIEALCVKFYYMIKLKSLTELKI